MARPSSNTTLEFALAPAGRRILFFTWVSVLLIAGFVAFNVTLAMQLPAHKFWPVVLAPLAGVPVVGLVWWFARIKSYRMTESELAVVRQGTTNRFALAGLVRVETGADVLQGMRKRMGNDGIGAITGEFRSKRLGDFEVYATDTAKAVVLHWPDHRLAVSPANASQFIEALVARTACRRE